jgi:hypothetical protein
VEKSVSDLLTFRADVQDSRLLGSGFVSTQGETFLLQGYVQFHNILGMPLDVQAGRFQMQYGTERFIGRSLWHYVERAFDGVRARLHLNGLNLDYFHIAHTNSSPYMLKVNPNYYPYGGRGDEGYGMYGFWLNTNVASGHSADLFGYLEDNDAANFERYTAGFNYNAKMGSLKAIAEIGYQFGGATHKPEEGESLHTDFSAYMGSLKFIYDHESMKYKLGADVYSGTAPDAARDEFNTFVNYPASKHKFFGLMDYFLVTTAGMNTLGVNDIYAGITFGDMTIGKPASGKINAIDAMLTYHYFMSNIADSDDNTDWGHEIDLVLKYNMTKGIFLQAGGGVFLPGEVMKSNYAVGEKVRDDPSFWLFTMLMVNL